MLVDNKLHVSAVSRRPVNDFSHPVNVHLVNNIDGETKWGDMLQGIDIVVHTAARAHIMDDTVSDPLTEYRKVNVEGTLNLARQAAKADVKRFIFISSIKVNGESTDPGKCFSETVDAPPLDPYGLSKYEAELGIDAVAVETGMELVIIRPPLVYGYGVKANLKSMMKLLSWGLPLPLGAINNHRSLLALDNLTNFILVCLDHPKAANQTFLVSDDHDLSTTQLSKLLGDALGKPACLLPVPVSWIKLAATLTGKQSVYQKICGSLQVDITKAKNMLGWKPPVSVEEGIKSAAIGFLDEKNH